MGAAGFFVGQEKLLKAIGLEAAAELVARKYQRPVSEIKKKLDFGRLRTVDTFRHGAARWKP
jgi:hypothetical protein